MKIYKLLKKFLDHHTDRQKPLVCALSGGADSMCLFYHLQQLGQFYSELHVAHVDHGWRVESKKEAESLRQLADENGILFHLKVLDINRLRGNLEDTCRLERIKFFVDCAQNTGAQAVVLGHHADDQAETVLKRVLEGASLNKIPGIKALSVQEGVSFWRPLLSVPKKEIVEWMTAQGYDWLEDSTNFDPQYLRARMRQKLIPWLCEEFGKNVTAPLCRLASELEEVEGYLNRQVAPYHPQRTVQESFVCYDFTKAVPTDLLEWKVLVRAICESESFRLSRAQLDDIVRLLSERKVDKWVEFGGKRIKVDRGCLIFPS